MRSAVYSALALLLFAAGLAAQQSGVVTFRGLVNAMKIGGLSNTELAQIIKSRGVDFELNADKEGELKALGANAELLAAVRASYRGVPPAEEAQAPVPKRQVQDTAAPASASTLSGGPYYALVIGNNNYRYLHKLETPINDANAFAKLLQDRYGFAPPEVLLDATRDDIFTALTKYRRTLPENSNLLIYFAGHGHHDRDTDEAYWLPVDAQPDNPNHWISANDITTNIRAIPAKHVLIISDSCYSGVLTRGVDAAINPLKPDAYLAKMLGSKSRNLMSSGGDEPVADVGPEGHSVFANAVLKSLREMEDQQFSAADLFQKFIKRAVAGRSDQVPQYSFIRNSGDEFGDFVFTRSKLEGARAREKTPLE